MKSLNDSLREEFSEIMKKSEFSEIISKNNLDKELLEKAFDVLLKHKLSSQTIDNARRDLENFLVNHFKTLNH